jgi:hypothetical protein
MAAKVVQSQASDKLGAQTRQTIQSLSDPDSSMRRYAATDLASLALMNEAQADAAAAALVPRLVGDTADVRVAAIEAASALAPKLSSARRTALFHALLQSTADPNSEVRIASAKALGIVASDSDRTQQLEARDALLRSLSKAEDIFELRAAAESLAALPLSSSERAEMIAVLKEQAAKASDPVVLRALSDALERLQKSYCKM